MKSFAHCLCVAAALLVPACPVLSQCEDLFPGRSFPVSNSYTTDFVDVDVDADGVPDLICTIYASSANLVIVRGLGSGSYAPPTTFTLAGIPKAIRASDIDGDGKADLVVAMAASGSIPSTIAIMKGDSPGWFQPPVYLAVPPGFAANRIALGDFDHDGHLDLVTAGSSSTASAVFVYRGLGDGTFDLPQSQETGAASINFLLPADFNGDGRLDLAVIRSTTTNSLSILLNAGDGSFGAPVSYAPLTSANFASCGDIDHDGDVDIVVATGSGGAKVFLSNGNGTFGPALTVPGSFTQAVYLTDLNHDGFVDLIGVGAGFEGQGVTVCYNDHAGFFGPPLLYSAGAYPMRLAFVDHNGDGEQDLTILNTAFLAAPQSVSTLYNRGNGVFASRNDYVVQRYPRYVAAGDLNGDGFVDLAVTGYPGDGLQPAASVLFNLNQGSGTFGLRRDITSNSGRSIALGDLDRDGDLDMVVGNMDSACGVLFNSGAGVFSAPTLYDFSGPGHMNIADLDNDGDLDIVALLQYSGMAVRKNNGLGIFGPATSYATDNNPAQVEFGDFNHDGLLDAAVPCYLSDVVDIFLGIGNAAFGPRTVIPTGPRPYSIAISDLNADGNLDFVVANSNDYANSVAGQPGSLGVYFGRGDGTFASPVLLSTGSNPYYIACGDVDGDSLPDLISANTEKRDSSQVYPGRNTVSVIRNAGNGVFLPSLDFAADVNGICIALADVNGDHNLDIVTANYIREVQAGSTVSVFKARPIAPRISIQPRPLAVSRGAMANFSVAAAALNPRTFQWRKNSIPIPASTNPSAVTPTLTLQLVQQADVGDYDCVISNGCGAVTTALARLSICVADFNNDGSVDFFDYLDFVSAFAANDPAADVNSDSVIDFFDYLDFVSEFSAGC